MMEDPRKMTDQELDKEVRILQERLYRLRLEQSRRKDDRPGVRDGFDFEKYVTK